MLPLKNVLKGTKTKKKKKKTGTLSQTFNEHFYSERFVGAMPQVMWVWFYKVDQTDKINTIISHDPEWAGKRPVVWTEHPSHLWMWRQLAGGMSDSAPVRRAALKYFLLPFKILQEVRRCCSRCRCTRWDSGLLLSWCNRQKLLTIFSERPPELDQSVRAMYPSRGCYCLHKHTQTLPIVARHLSNTYANRTQH